MSTSNKAPSAQDTDSPLADLPRMLTVGEAATFLRRSTRSLRAWESKGLVRFSRPAGGRPLVPRSEIERLLREGTVTP